MKYERHPLSRPDDKSAKPVVEGLIFRITKNIYLMGNRMFTLLPDGKFEWIEKDSEPIVTFWREHE